MATLDHRHRDAETRMRFIIEDAGLPQPDDVEYDDDLVVLFWHEHKLVVEIDLSDGPG